MKNRLFILLSFLLSLSLVSTFGCSSDEPLPEPVGPGKSNYGLNKKDSLFVVDMIEMMMAQDALPASMNWDPEDARTWNKTDWTWDEANREYRLERITIYPKSHGRCTISEKILDCEYLRSLILGGGISEVPGFVSRLHLTSLGILHTYISELPEDIFNERLTAVRVEGNELLTKLPSSVTELVSRSEHDVFNFGNNGFTGEIPPITKAYILLWHNKFTSIKLSNQSLRLNRMGAVNATYNHITGVVPDDVLADTVKLCRFHQQVSPQKEGYGFSNLPSDKEMGGIYQEWYKNHPYMKL